MARNDRRPADVRRGRVVRRASLIATITLGLAGGAGGAAQESRVREAASPVVTPVATVRITSPMGRTGMSARIRIATLCLPVLTLFMVLSFLGRVIQTKPRFLTGPSSPRPVASSTHVGRLPLYASLAGGCLSRNLSR